MNNGERAVENLAKDIKKFYCCAWKHNDKTNIENIKNEALKNTSPMPLI